MNFADRWWRSSRPVKAEPDRAARLLAHAESYQWVLAAALDLAVGQGQMAPNDIASRLSSRFPLPPERADAWARKLVVSPLETAGAVLLAAEWETLAETATGGAERLRATALDQAILHPVLARWKLDAVEPTSYYFLKTDRDYLIQLKRQVFLAGLEISGTPTNNNFCTKDEKVLSDSVIRIKEWVDHAVGRVPALQLDALGRAREEDRILQFEPGAIAAPAVGRLQTPRAFRKRDDTSPPLIIARP